MLKHMTQHQTATLTKFVTRFAPSPTGELHKGHAYSALLAYRAAQKEKGRFLLRIEDIDTTRCKPHFIQNIYDDLSWLGIKWEEPVLQQRERMRAYSAAIQQLTELDVMYPCFCTRKDIQNHSAVRHGPEGVIYPGTCKHLSEHDITQRKLNGENYALRLNLSKALNILPASLTWHNKHKGEIEAQPLLLGDVILARKDTPTSYHLSVVIDDAFQHVNHIIRGMDLWHATHIHIVLQKLLKLNTPLYHHHELLLDENGEKFAKRNKSVSLQSIKESGITALELKKELGF